MAFAAVQRIGALFEIERGINGQSPIKRLAKTRRIIICVVNIAIESLNLLALVSQP